MWILCLNDMRAPQVEILRPVCRAETREQLDDFIERERVASYSDGHWNKNYRRGGPLEWFNPPWDFEAGRHFVNVGTRQQAAEMAMAAYDEQVMSVPEIAAMAA